MFDPEIIAAEFCEFVQVDSLSGHEAEFAQMLEERLQAIGIPTWYDNAGMATGGDVGNLWSKIEATAPELPTVILNAHMDTVKPGIGIHPQRNGDTLSSNGNTILAGDDKAGCAVLMAVVRELLETRPDHGDIHILFTIAEETGLNGAKAIDFNAFKVDYALVLDGGRHPGAICTAAPSAVKLSFEITGKASHSGVHPELGISAIHTAGKALAAMRLGRIDADTTANIGIIEGGEARNIIPAQCTMFGEARSHDPKKLAHQSEHMQKCVRRACNETGATSEISETHSYTAFHVPDNHPLVKAAIAAAETLDFEPEIQRGGGGSDANVYNAHGIPAIIMPTGASGAHTLEETVSVAALGGCADFLYETILGLTK